MRLDYLSNTSGNNERQYLCQKKPLPSQDGALDYAFLVQRGNNSGPAPNFGKDSGFSGRELQLVFGIGESTLTWAITSNLEINDLNWHHVSVAYDTHANVVRFGIDDTFETIPFADNTKVINDGPLRVGGHQNNQGVDNFFLRGSIDELRMSKEFLPPEHLLNAPLQDCNGNGVSDLWDIRDGTSEDCNGNLVPDECEIASGVSEDCQPDGIPDECQLTESAELLYDHGWGRIAWRADESYMAWLNRFNVADGAGVVDAIEVLWGIMPLGTQVDAYVWTDPDGDGDPTDAQVLWSDTVTVLQTETFSTIDVPDVEVGDTGASFFVGFIVSAVDPDFPATLDIDGVPIPDRSWGVGSNSPIDPNNLSAGAVEFGTINNLLFGNVWLIRTQMRGPGTDCNGDGSPDVCDIADGISADADGDGVPDECQDCNGNGVVDGFDIAGGTSLDCNADGVPDECQVPANDCDGDGVPDDCQLEGNDCNENGILDACDIASGYDMDADGSGVPDECEDCNGNSVLDSIDIAMSFSDDCNADGVPDECQFGEPENPVRYVYDDGVQESNLCILGGSGLEYAWMNHFTVQPGGEWISAIEVVWGDTYPDLPAEVVLWTDPDGDGDPVDAQVILTVDTRSMKIDSPLDNLNVVPIPPTYVGPAGISFFVGVHFDDIWNSGCFIALDVDEPISGEGWFAYAPSGALDLNNLSAYWHQAWPYHNMLVRAVGFEGELENDCNVNQTLDACDIDTGASDDGNGNGVPDECEEGVIGDLDGDGDVDFDDLNQLLAVYGLCVGEPGYNPEADLDGDLCVGFDDLNLLLANYGVGT